MSIDDSTHQVQHAQQAQLRLLQFLSPVAPVGAYSYSQGLEWAVHKSWVTDEPDFQAWIEGQIATILGEQELPLLIRLYRAVRGLDVDAFAQWANLAFAVRDTAELRQEELDRAAAYFRILQTIDPVNKSWPHACFHRTPLASMAWFAVQHGVDEQALLTAFAHNWLESSLTTGIKIIPLGQSAGQRLLYELSPQLLLAIDKSQSVSDECVGVSLPAMSFASAGHEALYSRVYRS